MTGVRFTIFCSVSSLALSPALAQQEEDAFDLGAIVLKGELVVEGQPNENLNLLDLQGYAPTTFTDFNNASLSFDGNQFDGAPEWTGAVGASHGWSNGVTLAVDASHTEASFADDANTLRSDDRGLINSQLTLERDEGWIVGLYVRNLLDAEYVVQLFNGGTRGRVGERRTVDTSLTRSF